MNHLSRHSLIRIGDFESPHTVQPLPASFLNVLVVKVLSLEALKTVEHTSMSALNDPFERVDFPEFWIITDSSV